MSFRVSDALRNGLRSDERLERTPDYLSACVNLVATKWGLAGPKAITNPFADTVSWPFPQYLRGNAVSLLAGETTVQTVNENTWAGTALTVYNPLTEAVATIPAGGVWSMVDFWDAWALFNGSCVVYKLNRQGMVGQTNLAYVQATAAPVCGCSLKGRAQAVFGGYDLRAWQPQFDAMADSSTLTYTPSQRGNVVFYTSIGGGDLEWALVPQKMPENWRQIVRENTMGFIVMPFQGTVLHVKQLGNGFVAYGEDGVSYLNAMSAPEPGFGFAWSERIGVASRGAVAGNESRHLFIDPSGTLWQATAQGLTRLGYQEYLSQMLGTHIVGSYDPFEEEFYFCNESVGFIYRNGLTETENRTTGTQFVEGGLVGITDGTPDLATFTTQTFDMGVRSIKHICNVELAYSGLTDVEVMVKASFAGEELASTRWVPCSPKGVAFPTQSGVDFQLSVRGAVSGNPKIDLMTVRWKQNDNSAIRGYYAYGSN